MNSYQVKAALLSVLASFTVAGAMAAGETAASKPAKGDAPMQHGMMSSDGHMDMGAMMGMMSSCQSMMGGTGLTALPKLPPGNEKLELQMRAEMMQKMGEIAAKYADKIKESR